MGRGRWSSTPIFKTPTDEVNAWVLIKKKKDTKNELDGGEDVKQIMLLRLGDVKTMKGASEFEVPGLSEGGSHLEQLRPLPPFNG